MPKRILLDVSKPGPAADGLTQPPGTDAGRFFDLTLDLLSVIGFDGYRRRVNPAWEKTLGWSTAELLATPALELVHPDDVRSVLAIRQQILDAGGPLFSYECRYRCKDGSYRILLWTATTVPEEQVTYSSGRDITERRKAEDDLRASESRFRMLFESSPLPKWLYDVQTLRFLEVNEAALRAYGYSREEFLRMTIRDIRGPEEMGRLERAAADTTLGAADHGVWVHRGRDGVPMNVAIRGETFLLDGRLARLVVAQDITQRLRQEEQQRKLTVELQHQLAERTHAEQLLLARGRIAALAAEAGLVLTTGGSIAEVSQRCADAMVTHLSAVTACIWTLRGDEPALELQTTAGAEGDPCHARVRIGETVVGRIAQQRAPWHNNDLPGDPRFSDWAWASRHGVVAFAGYPLLVEDRLVGVMALYSRHAFSALEIDGLGSIAHSIAVGIRRKLAEATQAQLEGQLRQAQKMEAIGSLAGGIAHDFNNLLSVILSYARLLADDLAEGNPMRADLEEIRSAGERASSLTRQLLAFSRQQVLQPHVVDLNGTISGMDQLLRRVIGEDVEFVTVPSPVPATVHVDPGQIEQVIMNLVVNARDAMPSGGKLTLETALVALDDRYAASHPGAVAGPHVMLAVSDTGIGMDAATQARVFEPFFTTKAPGKGTGLGLSTVFGIVRQSAGTIWLYSEPGQGTTFKIYLPVAEQGMADVAAAPSPAARNLRGNETILLVEDDAQVRNLGRTVLQRNGYTVIEARGGTEALELFSRRPEIDLLLTDVVMPQMGGAQVAARLLEVRPGLKVLYMSGYTDNAVVLHGVLHSSVAFLQKPLTPEVLLAKVRDVLDTRPAEAVPRKPETAKPRVLVVDDEEVMQRLIARALPGCEVIACDGAPEALKRLARGEQFAVVLCDLHLQGMDGVQFHQRLLELHSPVAGTMIFMTGGAMGGAAQRFVREMGPRVLQKPMEVRRLREVVETLLAGAAG